METKRLIIILFVFFAAIPENARSQNEIIKAGLIRTQATISFSDMLNSGNSYFYLHGNMEAYFNSKISFCGDAYAYMGALNGVSDFAYNHNIFFGFLYHLTQKQNDTYLGFQPGMAFTRLNENKFLLTHSQAGINPEFSLVLGNNYYINPYFHFFVQGRLIVGSHNYNVHQNLSEFRFSAGLGFNINTLK
ncbi:MAG: hypothetical protein IT238_05195 [Bacteroidia bacterium]|nr:hypothetical protein [Bacteroidia bacterium]MCZ2248309.1 hypothetical protein [Bacteroidia bacterium]